jgi:hypothetical protein
MPGNKKPRKARKVISTKDVVSMLLDGDEPLKGEERIAVLTSVHAAARSLARGDGLKGAWDSIVSALNISLVLCEGAGNKEIGLEAVYDAQNAMIAIAERFHRTDRLVFSGDELVAMNGGIHVFEELVETVSKRQYVRASEEMLKRIEKRQVVKIQRGQKAERFELRRAA